MRRIVMIAACLAVLGALTSCATPQSSSGDPTLPAGGSVTPSTSEPLPSLTKPSKNLPEPGSTAPAGEITVTGVVQEGVEERCLLLEGYLLVSYPTPIRAGQRLTVTGRPDPSIMTTCQQGTPLIVSSVKPA